MLRNQFVNKVTEADSILLMYKRKYLKDERAPATLSNYNTATNSI